MTFAVITVVMFTILNVTPCILQECTENSELTMNSQHQRSRIISSKLIMEAVVSFEMSRHFYQALRRHTTEHSMFTTQAVSVKYGYKIILRHAGARCTLLIDKSASVTWFIS